jgi:transketolase
VPLLSLPRDTVKDAARGAYIVQDVKEPTLVILATGSEVSLALEAAAMLKDEQVKVVSMPCWRLFAEQSRDYQERVLSPGVKRRVSIEAGVTLGWERYVGADGLKIGLDRYGESAPAEVLAEEYGFTAKKVVQRIQSHKFA